MEDQSTLLIVDDMAENQAILARRFRRQGFQTIEVESGKLALELLELETIDLVLLDVMMPAPDGLKVLRQIRCKRDQMQLPSSW